jgi:hypothetical protein
VLEFTFNRAIEGSKNNDNFENIYIFAVIYAKSTLSNVSLLRKVGFNVNFGLSDLEIESYLDLELRYLDKQRC